MLNVLNQAIREIHFSLLVCVKSFLLVAGNDLSSAVKCHAGSLLYLFCTDEAQTLPELAR